MIIDNAGYHKKKELWPYFAENKRRLRLLWLPPYSPDLNPIERVWRLTRRHVTHNRYFESLDFLRESLDRFFGEGLIRYFPGRRAVVINCDNNSPDHTKEAFLETATEVPKIYISTAPGVRGKGNNLRNLFRKAVELQAKAIVVVDADVQTLTPEWIKHLGEPVVQGFCFCHASLCPAQV